MSQRYKMILAYDGTRYAGWQVQPGERTVQGEVEASLEELTGERVRVHGSGRTDAGVHARAQVAHFELDLPKDPGRLVPGLNAVLDRDIRVDRVSRSMRSSISSPSLAPCSSGCSTARTVVRRSRTTVGP